MIIYCNNYNTIGLSRREQGFESPWGHHSKIRESAFFELTPFFDDPAPSNKQT